MEIMEINEKKIKLKSNQNQIKFDKMFSKKKFFLKTKIKKIKFSKMKFSKIKFLLKTIFKMQN